jgi:DNA-binding CsgD family transcriptional regulator
MTFDDDSLIDAIYEAAAVPELWSSVLDRFSERLNGSGGILFASSGNGVKWIASGLMRESFDKFVRDGWYKINPRPQRLAALNYNGFVQDLDAFTLEELDREPVYTEYLRKNHGGWAVGTQIESPGGDTIILSFERQYEKGAYDKATTMALDPLRPHFARAALLSSRLGLERAQAMAQALHAVGLPAAILRAGGRLFAANDLMQRLMPDVVRDTPVRIALVDKSADALLSAAIERVQEQGFATGGAVSSFAIRATERHDPMIAHLLPVCGAAHDIFATASAILLITPVQNAASPDSKLLQALFDLTPAESRIAQGIGRGETVDTIAARLGISAATARSQLKGVMAKTGVGRQTELALLLSGAYWPRRDFSTEQPHEPTSGPGR